MQVSSGDQIRSVCSKMLTFQFSSISAISALLLLPLVSSLPTPEAEAQLLPAAQNLQQPSLVRHADGRLFAVNAHLVPGQLFQTGDGRVFTLARTNNNHYGPPPPPSPPSPAPSPPSPAPASPGEPDNDDNEGVIEARIPEAVTEAPTTEQPQLRSQLHSLPFQVVGPGLRTVPAGPTVPLASVLPVVRRPPAPATVVVGQKTVAQSSQPVVTGYFSFPTAGFDFNF